MNSVDRVNEIDSPFVLLQLWESPKQIINGERKGHRRKSGRMGLVIEEEGEEIHKKGRRRMNRRFK